MQGIGGLDASQANKQGNFMAFHPDDDGAGPSGLSHHQSLQKESLYLMSSIFIIGGFHLDEYSVFDEYSILIIGGFHFDEYSIFHECSYFNMSVPF